MSESINDEQLLRAARAIYDVLFTAAPIGFDEARRRNVLPYQRALAAAGRAGEAFLRADA